MSVDAERAEGLAREVRELRTELDELERFEAWLIAMRYSPKSITVYIKYVARAAAFVAPTELVDASFADLTAWWATLPTSAASRNQGRKALCAFFVAHGTTTGARP